MELPNGQVGMFMLETRDFQKGKDRYRGEYSIR